MCNIYTYYINISSYYRFCSPLLVNLFVDSAGAAVVVGQLELIKKNSKDYLSGDLNVVSGFDCIMNICLYFLFVANTFQTYYLFMYAHETMKH